MTEFRFEAEVCVEYEITSCLVEDTTVVSGEAIAGIVDTFDNCCVDKQEDTDFAVRDGVCALVTVGTCFVADPMGETVERDIDSMPANPQDCDLCVEEAVSTEFRYENDACRLYALFDCTLADGSVDM